jgi:hypothetical protein
MAKRNQEPPADRASISQLVEEICFAEQLLLVLPQLRAADSIEKQMRI